MATAAGPAFAGAPNGGALDADGGQGMGYKVSVWNFSQRMELGHGDPVSPPKISFGTSFFAKRGSISLTARV